MSVGTDKKIVTTVTRLAILQSFVKKKYFLRPALDKLLYAHNGVFYASERLT